MSADEVTLEQLYERVGAGLRIAQTLSGDVPITKQARDTLNHAWDAYTALRASMSRHPEQDVGELPTVLRLGEGASIVETGTYLGERAVFIEPAPTAGRLGEPSNRATPQDDVLPGGVILVIGKGGPQVLIDALNRLASLSRHPEQDAGAGFDAAVSAIRGWAKGFLPGFTKSRLEAVATDLERHRAEILAQTPTPPSQGA